MRGAGRDFVADDPNGGAGIPAGLGIPTGGGIEPLSPDGPVTLFFPSRALRSILGFFSSAIGFHHRGLGLVAAEAPGLKVFQPGGTVAARSIARKIETAVVAWK